MNIKLRAEAAKAGELLGIHPANMEAFKEHTEFLVRDTWHWSRDIRESKIERANSEAAIAVLERLRPEAHDEPRSDNQPDMSELIEKLKFGLRCSAEKFSPSANRPRQRGEHGDKSPVNKMIVAFLLWEADKSRRTPSAKMLLSCLPGIMGFMPPVYKSEPTPKESAVRRWREQIAKRIPRARQAPPGVPLTIDEADLRKRRDYPVFLTN